MAAAGLVPSGCSKTLVPPPTKASVPLESRRRPEWLTSLGLGTEASLWLPIQVSHFLLDPTGGMDDGIQVGLGSIFNVP